jgi:hypothetical protein
LFALANESTGNLFALANESTGTLFALANKQTGNLLVPPLDLLEGKAVGAFDISNTFMPRVPSIHY